MNKYLTKLASLLSGKRFIGKISPKTFKFRGKVKDTDTFDKLHSLHSTAERQTQAGTPARKLRLELGNGSKAFIRSTDKGTRSRVYSE